MPIRPVYPGPVTYVVPYLQCCYALLATSNATHDYWKCYIWCCNTDVLGVLLIYLHSPSGVAHSWDHAYVSVKSLTAMLQPINVCMYVCMYVYMYILYACMYTYICAYECTYEYIVCTLASYICSCAYDKGWKLSRHSLSLVNSLKFPLIMYSKFVCQFGQTDA